MARPGTRQGPEPAATLFDMSPAEEEEEAKEVRVSLHNKQLSPMPLKSNIPMAQVKVD